MKGCDRAAIFFKDYASTESDAKLGYFSYKGNFSAQPGAFALGMRQRTGGPPSVEPKSSRRTQNMDDSSRTVANDGAAPRSRAGFCGQSCRG